MDKILITGSEGFIGSHLTERLVKEGYRVKAFVLYNSFNSWGWLDTLSTEIRSEIEIFTGDIRDPHGIKTALDGCRSVFHLAALIGIPFSYHSPSSYISTNVQGTLNVLQAAKDLNLEKVIHTSTSEVYGSAQYVPIDENHPLVGQSPYSASKIAADQLAYSFYASFGLPVVTIRPFNTFGPRQSARAVIPTIIAQIENGASKINLGNLETYRDFNYVNDTVEGFISAEKSKHAIGETINLCSGREISIANTVKAISEIMKKHVEINIDKQRVRPEKSEVKRLCGCNKKATKLLNLNYDNPAKNFLEGLEKTIEWFKNKNNMLHYKSNIYNI